MEPNGAAAAAGAARLMNRRRDNGDGVSREKSVMARVSPGRGGEAGEAERVANKSELNRRGNEINLSPIVGRGDDKKTRAEDLRPPLSEREGSTWHRRPFKRDLRIVRGQPRSA